MLGFYKDTKLFLNPQGLDLLDKYLYLCTKVKMIKTRLCKLDLLLKVKGQLTTVKETFEQCTFEISDGHMFVSTYESPENEPMIVTTKLFELVDISSYRKQNY